MRSTPKPTRKQSPATILERELMRVGASAAVKEWLLAITRNGKKVKFGSAQKKPR